MPAQREGSDDTGRRRARKQQEREARVAMPGGWEGRAMRVARVRSLRVCGGGRLFCGRCVGATRTRKNDCRRVVLTNVAVNANQLRALPYPTALPLSTLRP